MEENKTVLEYMAIVRNVSKRLAKLGKYLTKACVALRVREKRYMAS